VSKSIGLDILDTLPRMAARRSWALIPHLVGMVGAGTGGRGVGAGGGRGRGVGAEGIDIPPRLSANASKKMAFSSSMSSCARYFISFLVFDPGSLRLLLLCFALEDLPRFLFSLPPPLLLVVFVDFVNLLLF